MFWLSSDAIERPTRIAFLEICLRNSVLQAQVNEPGYAYSFPLL